MHPCPDSPLRGRQLPKSPQLELDLLEGLGADAGVSFKGDGQEVLGILEAEDLERPYFRVYQPDVGDVLAGVDAELPNPVDARGAGREDLAEPVRGERQIGFAGDGGEPLATPSGKVRDQHVAAEVELGFVEDPPATRPAAAEIEWPGQPIAQNR